MKPEDYSEFRDLIEWRRPSGQKHVARQPMTKDAASVYDTVTKAGYVYSIEWIGNAYAFYISRDDLEMDIVTDIIKGETSEQQRGALSRSITRNPLDVLERKVLAIIEMMAQDDGQA
jgi:hypothetical protein